MKKTLRLTALVLALVMLLGVTAFAVENEKMTITGIDGTTVTFDPTVDEKINVTYESTSIKEGQFYLVMVVAKGEGDTYIPTKDTILYINQTTGVDTGKTDANGEKIGKIVFGGETALYPTTIKDSAILIYGSNIDGEASSLIAAIIEGKYILGDVDEDGEITTSDAAAILRAIANNEEFVGSEETAADTDGDSSVTTSDAAKILRFVAGLIDTL